MSFYKNGNITANIQDCDYVEIPVSISTYNSGSVSKSNSQNIQYTIVSAITTSKWGSGFHINDTNVPYGCWYEISFEAYMPTSHYMQIDVNNYVVGATSWSGNDNDLISARYGTNKTIAANTWTPVMWYTQNAHASNTSKVPICVYDGVGLRTSSDTASVTWYIRNLKFRIYYNRNEYFSIGDGIIYPKHLIEI